MRDITMARYGLIDKKNRLVSTLSFDSFKEAKSFFKPTGGMTVRNIEKGKPTAQKIKQIKTERAVLGRLLKKWS